MQDLMNFHCPTIEFTNEFEKQIMLKIWSRLSLWLVMSNLAMYFRDPTRINKLKFICLSKFGNWNTCIIYSIYLDHAFKLIQLSYTMWQNNYLWPSMNKIGQFSFHLGNENQTDTCNTKFLLFAKFGKELKALTSTPILLGMLFHFYVDDWVVLIACKKPPICSNSNFVFFI